jgi:hypothetical protein
LLTKPICLIVVDEVVIFAVVFAVVEGQRIGKKKQ